jgi:hypothetical protein
MKQKQGAHRTRSGQPETSVKSNRPPNGHLKATNVEVGPTRPPVPKANSMITTSSLVEVQLAVQPGALESAHEPDVATKKMC